MIKKILFLIFTFLIPCNLNAATKNIVPNADNEGFLGSSSKRWSNVHTVTGTVVGEMKVGSMTVYGTVTSTSGFVGDGSKLTGITAATVQSRPLIAGDTGYFSIYSTNTISATQTFQSSITFSSTSLSIGGNLYHFQSSAPAVNSVLRYDDGGKVFWGNDGGGGGGVDQSSTYTWTGTHNYKGRISMQNSTPADDLTVTSNLYSLIFSPTPANAVTPAIYGFGINTGNIPSVVGHSIGVLGRSSDTENGHNYQFGVEGRADVYGDSTYRGVLAYTMGTFPKVTGSTATMYALEARSEVFDADGSTPKSTGTVASVYIPAIVGGASDAKWSIFQSGLTDPAYFGSPVGIGVQRPYGSGTVLHLGAATTPTQLIFSQNGGAVLGMGASSVAGGYTWIGSTSPHILLFAQNNGEAMRIDTSRNIGINTTAPTQKLSVVGTVDVSSMMVYGTVTSTSGFVGDGSKLTGVVASAAQTRPLIAGDTGYMSIYSSQTITGSPIFKFNEYLSPLNVRLSSTSNCVLNNSTNSIYPSLLCDDTTDEAFNWTTNIKSFAGTNLYLKIYFTMISATTGKVRLDSEIMCASPNASADIDSPSYSVSSSTSVTVQGTAGYLGTATMLINNDSCQSGDLISIQGRRVPSDTANDTATGDIEIRGALLYEP